MRSAMGNKNCPNCGRRVGWVRRWWKPWIWARWVCPACGAVLGFSAAWHLIGVLVLALLMGLLCLLEWLVGIPEPYFTYLWPSVIIVGAPTVQWLFQSVVLRSRPAEPLKRLLPRE